MMEIRHCFDSRGLTPLHTAAARGASTILALLVEKTTNIEIRCENSSKDTPLILAARCGQVESIKVLQDHKASIDSRDGNNYTALMVAANEFHAEAVAAPLERGADPNSRDKKGLSGPPLLLASGRNGRCIETMKILIQHKADVNLATHPHGLTPFLKASDVGNDREVEYLLSAGANPNVHDISCRTPLRHAIFHSREPSIRMLLDAGANREAIFDDDIRPVHLAALCENYKIMQMLLEVEVDVNAPAGAGLNRETALHMAVLKRHTTVVKLLIAKGAGVNPLNAHKKTPLGHALEIENETLEKGLKASGGNKGS
jgi:ankyrin repeat protein